MSMRQTDARYKDDKDQRKKQERVKGKVKSGSEYKRKSNWTTLKTGAKRKKENNSSAYKRTLSI